MGIGGGGGVEEESQMVKAAGCRKTATWSKQSMKPTPAVH